MGDGIEVDSGGLHILAAQCDEVAGALASSMAERAPGPGGQATSAAVTGGYADIRAVMGQLSARIASTGYKLRTASGVYRTTDEGSAQTLAIEV